MGINQLFQIIIPAGNYAGQPIVALARESTLPKLKGIRVCIDASNTIYSAILAMAHINALSDKSGRTTAHINMIWTKVLQLDKAMISQIWIFDNPQPNALKAATVARRRDRAYKSSDPKVQFRMQTEHVNDIKTLLDLMGIPYIEAPPGIEAEQYGAWMTKGDIAANRFCQYMISADSDVLAFGGNLLRAYQKPTATGKGKRLVYQIFELRDMLQELGLTYDEFLEVCVAMGTDFCDKTDRVGVKTVIKNVKDGKIFPNDMQKTVIEYFKARPAYNESDAHFSECRTSDLVAFLAERGFNADRVKKSMEDFPRIKYV